MFSYHFQNSLYTVDYYTDELSIFALYDQIFSHTNIWVARRQARLFLLKLLKDVSIVRYYKVSLEIRYALDNQTISLGTWFVSNYPPRQHFWSWDWETEHQFLDKYQLYRSGDRELIAIEKEYYQNRPLTEEKKNILEEKLNHFCHQFEAEIRVYSTEIAFLYLFLENKEKAFSYFSVEVLPEAQWIVYQTALYLAHLSPKPDYQFMRKYEAMYPKPLPFLF